MKQLLILISALAITGAATAQKSNTLPSGLKAGQAITQQMLTKHVYLLASDSLEGRETGFAGQRMAADYIKSYMKEHGVQPFGDTLGSYLQHYKLVGYRNPFVSIKANGIEFKEGEDFIKPFGRAVYEKNGRLPEDLVFGGWGIKTDNYNDYTTVQAQGRTVIILEGVPKNDKGEALYNLKAEDWIPSLKAKIAFEEGANNVFVVTTSAKVSSTAAMIKKYTHSDEYKMRLKDQYKPEEKGVFYITNKMAAQLFNMDTLQFAKLYNTSLPKKRKRVKGNAVPIVQANITGTLDTLHLTSSNVVGLIPGDKYPNEYVVLSAHYDHLGIQGGEVYNGADDNGTGTAAVLEMGKAFAAAKKLGIKTGRSIICLLVSGEEKGLLGSAYFVSKPPVSLDKIYTNINTDMIGRVDDAHKDSSLYVYPIGSNILSPQLDSLSKAVNKQTLNINLDYRFNDPDEPNRFYYRSDHYNFAKNGIPCIFYFSGVHEDYHKPTDTADKILYDKATQLTRLIFYTAWEVSQYPTRLMPEKGDNIKKGKF